MTNRGSCVWKFLAVTSAIGLAGLAVSCVTEDEDPAGTGGASGSGGAASGGTSGSGGATSGGATAGGSGGSTTSGGSAGSGGAAETGGAAGAPPTDAVACPTPTAPAITDFTYVEATPPTPDQVTFGDFTNTFSGGTLYYPETLTSDVTTGVWHISGSVNDYAGFGLYFSAPTGGCAKVDASAFQGISFTISGTLPEGRSLTMWVSTAGNQISSAWYASQVPPIEKEPSFGRCTPQTGEYDNTCKDSTYPVTLSATPTPVQVLWSDLTGGKPAASPDPAEITGIGWYVTWNGATDTAYPIDITIDDLAFIE